MEFRTVGRSGLAVSALGLGCNNFGMRIGAQESAEVVAAALDSGVTLFDTAPMYGGGSSEEFLGAALGARRADVVIATKFGAPRPWGPGQPAASRASVLRECDASLRRLGTEYIDLYYQHYPDSASPAEETYEALQDLIKQGKVRYLAHSNLAAWELTHLDHVAGSAGGPRFISSQFEWNLLARAAEQEMVPACRFFDLGMIAYFPLASGLLTGKYLRGSPFPEGTRYSALPILAGAATEENFDKVDRLQQVAASCNRSILELAIGWLASQPGLSSVLVGATSARQVLTNVAASSWRLTPTEMALVDEAVSTTDVVPA